MFEEILNLVATFIKELLEVLPTSPFLYMDSLHNDDWTLVLKYLDYTMNISTIIVLAELWVGGLAIYYMISVPLKWSKIVGS